MARKPVIGCAFDPDFRTDTGRVEGYINELRYYRPRGYSKLEREGFAMIRHHDFEFSSDWMDEADTLLTEWARRIKRHDYVVFGTFEHGGGVGFYWNVRGFLEDADLKVSDTGEVPKGFSGLVAQVSDHGNVTAYSYSRGRARELFSVV